MTCHTVFPKLLALGEAFRLNGYKLPDADELYVKDQPVSLGAEPYKRYFPRFIWPSDIPGMPPLSIRATGVLNVNYGDTNGTRRIQYPIQLPRRDPCGGRRSWKGLLLFVNLAFTTESGTTTAERAGLVDVAEPFKWNPRQKPPEHQGRQCGTPIDRLAQFPGMKKVSP